MEAAAIRKNSPHSPRKMRLLADLIRGMAVDKALFALRLHPKKMYAREMEKVLLSAVSNWENHNEGESLEENELIVKTIKVDNARFLKRIQPAPQGRAHRIRKRYNHITIVVDRPDSVSNINTENEE